MSSNALFAKEQNCFLSNRSTQLLAATKYWSNVLQHDNLNWWIWCFKKVFDVDCSHQRLLLSLESNGIESNLLDWVTTFLTDRKQRVVVNESYSLMLLMVSPKDQYWTQFYSVCTLMAYLTHYQIKFQFLLTVPSVQQLHRIDRNNSVYDTVSSIIMQRDIHRLN